MQQDLESCKDHFMQVLTVTHRKPLIHVLYTKINTSTSDVFLNNIKSCIEKFTELK